MLTNEDLLAISNLMDVKLKPIKEDIAELKQDVAILKQDVAILKQDVAGLKGEVSGLKQDVAGLKQDVAGLKQDVAVLKEDVADLKQRMNNVEYILENDMQPRLRNIENCYVTTYQRYYEKTEQVDALHTDVVILKGVAQEHSIKIKELSQAVM